MSGIGDKWYAHWSMTETIVTELLNNQHLPNNFSSNVEGKDDITGTEQI